MACARLAYLLLVGAALLSGWPGAPRALAQQQPAGTGQRFVLPAPGPSDWTATGAPAASDDPDASVRPGREPPIDCGRDLPCRVRLRGVLGKNGGIAVEGTAFTW
jgi:hypothetical protein